jgi:hypothetical protein
MEVQVRALNKVAFELTHCLFYFHEVTFIQGRKTLLMLLSEHFAQHDVYMERYITLAAMHNDEIPVLFDMVRRLISAFFFRS